MRGRAFPGLMRQPGAGSSQADYPGRGQGGKGLPSKQTGGDLAPVRLKVTALRVLHV